MVTLEQLVARVTSEIDRVTTDHEVFVGDIAAIVKLTIDGLGFHVNEATGEVCDPRPKPVINFPYDQHGTRWAGSGRRRR